MNAKKITKKAFLAAAKKGWETLKFTRYTMWLNSGLTFTENRKSVCYACSIGAAAYALKTTPDKLVGILKAQYGDEFPYEITGANDKYHSKAAALRAISKLKWGA